VRRNIGREAQLPQIDRADEIGDLSRALSEMTAALYRQIDAVEAFAADVAHELKNPLSSLHSAVESLERTDKPELRARLLAIIKEDVRRIDRLISDISDASRLDAELSRGRMERIELDRLAGSIVRERDARESDSVRGVHLRLDLPETGTIVVDGIESRLTQLLDNLIDNAISFSPEGGTVRLRLWREGAWAALAVEDEGPGLPPGAESKIFDRFYSERPEEEAFGRHSGLGLSICRQIADAHGGASRAESRPACEGSEKPAGARFVLRLPLAERD